MKDLKTYVTHKASTFYKPVDVYDSFSDWLVEYDYGNYDFDEIDNNVRNFDRVHHTFEFYGDKYFYIYLCADNDKAGFKNWKEEAENRIEELKNYTVQSDGIGLEIQFWKSIITHNCKFEDSFAFIHITRYTEPIMKYINSNYSY